MLIDNFCPKSNLLNLCTLDIAVHSRHLGHQRATTLALFIFFNESFLCFFQLENETQEFGETMD